MKYSSAIYIALTALSAVCATPIAAAPKLSARSPSLTKHLRPVIEKRQQFGQGEPIDANGKGGPILGVFLRNDNV